MEKEKSGLQSLECKAGQLEAARCGQSTWRVRPPGQSSVRSMEKETEKSLAGPKSLECNLAGLLEAAVVSRVRGGERRRCQGRGQSSARADNLNVTRVQGRTT